MQAVIKPPIATSFRRVIRVMIFLELSKYSIAVDTIQEFVQDCVDHTKPLLLVRRDKLSTLHPFYELVYPNHIGYGIVYYTDVSETIKNTVDFTQYGVRWLVLDHNLPNEKMQEIIRIVESLK